MANSGYLKMIAAETAKMKLDEVRRQARDEHIVTPNGTVLTGQAARDYVERYQQKPAEWAHESRMQAQKDAAALAERSMVNQGAMDVERLREMGLLNRQRAANEGAMKRTGAEVQGRLDLQQLINMGLIDAAKLKTMSEQEKAAVDAAIKGTDVQFVEQYDDQGNVIGKTPFVTDKIAGTVRRADGMPTGGGYDPEKYFQRRRAGTPATTPGSGGGPASVRRPSISISTTPETDAGIPASPSGAAVTPMSSTKPLASSPSLSAADIQGRFAAYGLYPSNPGPDPIQRGLNAVGRFGKKTYGAVAGPLQHSMDLLNSSKYRR